MACVYLYSSNALTNPAAMSTFAATEKQISFLDTLLVDRLRITMPDPAATKAARMTSLFKTTSFAQFQQLQGAEAAGLAAAYDKVQGIAVGAIEKGKATLSKETVSHLITLLQGNQGIELLSSLYVSAASNKPTTCTAKTAAELVKAIVASRVSADVMTAFIA